MVGLVAVFVAPPVVAGDGNLGMRVAVGKITAFGIAAQIAH